MMLRKRIQEMLAQGPCSAEYIADVTRQPLNVVQMQLALLQRNGRIKEKTIYCAVPKMTAADRRFEAKLAGLPPAYQAAVGKAV